MARPIATLPFEVAAVITGSDAWRLDEDEADRHAVRLSDAGNELGVQIPYVAVTAYLTLIGVTVLDKLRTWRKEKKDATPTALSVVHAQKEDESAKSAT